MLNLLLTLATAIGLSMYSVSRVLRLALARNLVDKPDSVRKMHVRSTPVLGGLGVFIALSFAFTAFSFNNMPKELIRTFGGIIALFVVGLKDDLLPCKPWRRLVYEFVVAWMVVVGSYLRPDALFQLIGISPVSETSSIFLTCLFIVGTINAYNMIDGIDGLLTTLSLFGSSCFALIFYLYADYHWAQFALALAGSLLGFLVYNTPPARIFMGDSGSMLVGGAFSIMTLHMLSFDALSTDYFYFRIPPVIALSIVALPVFDMVVIFLVRIFSGHSPFVGDRRHAHHRLIDLGFNHFTATSILFLTYWVVLLSAYFIQLSHNLVASGLFTLLLLFSFELILIIVHKFRLQHIILHRPYQLAQTH